MPKKWTKEQKAPSVARRERMKALREQGLSYAEIGRLFGISRSRVHQIVSGYDKLMKASADPNGWYSLLKQHLFEEAGWRCQRCGKKRKLLAHHVDGNHRHNGRRNLVAMCASCHTILHAEERRRQGTRTIYLHQCKRCDKQWESQNEHPLRCGKCKSPYWNMERK